MTPFYSKVKSPSIYINRSSMKQRSCRLLFILSLVFRIILKIVQIFCSFPLKKEALLVETLGLWSANALLESHHVQQWTHGSSSVWLGRCFLGVLGFIQQRWFQQEQGARQKWAVSCWASAIIQNRSDSVCSLNYLGQSASEQAGSCHSTMQFG